jgi:hypothetical protein
LAFRSINSKRVDILIDQGGWPIIAVEFQGEAHYQGNAAIRDAVKKEALSKAGVAYVEVFPGDAPDEISLRLRKQLPAASTTAPASAPHGLRPYEAATFEPRWRR